MKRALLVLGVVMPVAAQADVVSPGPLQMRAREDIVLGVDTHAVVTLEAPAARLVANVGSVALDPGGHRAVLTLPAARYPQVALIAALDTRDSVVDWIAIPLAGQARVTVDTAPKASVVVRVGERDAPATLADRRGVAIVPIIVPPGAATARAFATATNGNVTEKQLALGAKPFMRTLAICSSPAAVLAVDAQGKPSSDAPAITTSSGTADVHMKQPGWFEARVATDDEATVTASFEPTTASSCHLVPPPQPPTAIAVSADRARHVAGDAAIELRVAVEYAGERRRIEPVLAIEADVGTIDTTGNSARWSLPAKLEGKRTARVHVVATWPGGRLARDLEIELAAAPASLVTIDPIGVVPADDERQLVVRISDAYGNPTDAKLRANARGNVGVFTKRSDGTYVARYVAPHTRELRADRIAIIDDTSGRFAHVTASLDPLPRRFGMSARTGVVANFKQITAPMLAIGGDMRLPILRERLALGIEVGAYRSTFDAGMDETISSTLQAVPVLARLALHERRGAFDFSSGVGAGVVFVSTQLASPTAGMVVEHATRPVTTAFAGVGYHGSWGIVGVEVGYVHATLTESSAMHGRIGGMSAAVGYRIER